MLSQNSSVAWADSKTSPVSGWRASSPSTDGGLPGHPHAGVLCVLASERDPCLPRLPGTLFISTDVTCHPSQPACPPPTLGAPTVSPSVSPPLRGQPSPGARPGFMRDGCQSALRRLTLTGGSE